MADNLTEADVTAIKGCHYRTRVWGGITYVDDKQCDENQTVDLFRIASGAHNIGIHVVRGMIEEYKHAANHADLNNPPVEVKIYIRKDPQGNLYWKELIKPTMPAPEKAPRIATLTPDPAVGVEISEVQPKATDNAEWVAAIVKEMVQLGFETIANIIKQALATPRSDWFSTDAFVASKDADMWIVASKADDSAELYHNDQFVGKLWPGQQLRQIIIDFKPGVNFLVAKVDNNSMPPGMASVQCQFAQNGQWVQGAGYHFTQDGQLGGGRTWYVITRYVAR